MSIISNINEPIHNERSAQINEILKQDKTTFDSWILSTKPVRVATIPLNVLRFLIPTPTFQTAQDPHNISIMGLSTQLSEVNNLNFIIFERRNLPVSDRNTLDNYMKVLRAFYERLAVSRVDMSNREKIPIPPLEIDPFHIEEYEFIEDGILTVEDFITNDISMRAIGPQLKVEWYSDHPHLHGIGMATSFYGKLRYAAKAMQYRFIVGENPSPGYFVKKLGRSTLEEIKPELRHEFSSKPTIGNTETVTIDFLFDEDKVHYLI